MASFVGLPAWKFRKVPAAHVPEDPSARVFRVQLRLCVAHCRGSNWRLHTLRFPHSNSGSVLMLVLTFGSTLRQDWLTVGIPLTYSLVYSLLLAGIRVNSYRIDRQLSRSL